MLNSEVQLFYIFLSGFLFLMPLGVFLATREVNDSQVNFWCLGFVCIAIGNLLVGFRGHMPSFISFEIAQAFATAGPFLRAISLRLELDSPTSTLLRESKHYLLAIFIYLAIFAWMVEYNAPENYRLIFVTLFHLGISIDLYMICRNIKAQSETKGTGMITVMAILMISALCFRLMGIITGLGGEGVFGRGLDQILAFVLLAIGTLLGSCGFLQLRLSKIARGKADAQISLNIAWAEKHDIAKLLHEKEILISSLMKANKTAATGALSASIAHELNQPLGASRINIQFLQMKLGMNSLDDQMGAEILAALYRDNERAAEVIRSLRSIFLDPELKTQETDITELIHNILVIVRPELKKNNISLTQNLCENKYISINRSEIQQVFLNILNNAIQALSRMKGDDKILALKSTVNGDSLQFTIEDNGPGVSEDHQKNLFELLDDVKKNGMGLGLWLCKHIVTRHGGKIWYERVAIQGAKFIFELPLKKV